MKYLWISVKRQSMMNDSATATATATGAAPVTPVKSDLMLRHITRFDIILNLLFLVGTVLLYYLYTLNN